MRSIPDNQLSLTERQQYWFDHLAAAEASGVSLKDYAHVHGLAVQSLYSGKQTLKRRGAWPPAGDTVSLCRAEVVESDTPVGGARSAMPVSCRVHLRNGVVVELGAAGALPLAELLQAAESL